MQKIILGLIVILALMSCKNPVKEAEDAKDKLDVRQDRNDTNQSAHYKSDNLGVQVKINHGKSVVHSSSKIQEEHFKFSIVLQAINIDGLFLTNQPIAASKSVNDSLQFYINDIPRVLAPKECRDILGLISPWVCEYNYSLDPNSIANESLHIKVNLTRDTGEILSAVFDLPAPIQLLEPRIPFNPIAPDDTALLSWQSGLPMHLYFSLLPLGCNDISKTIEVGEQDTDYIISSDSFPLSMGCIGPTKATLSTSKEWHELEGSTFKQVNITWGDYLDVFLFGDYKGSYYIE
jgi:hypothetical protein